MPVVTQKWSTPSLGGNRAVIEFEVNGVANAEQARNAVPFQKGSTHPKDSGLVMQERPEAHGEPPALILVVCEFTRPDFGTTTDPGSGEPGDPLLEPAKVRWTRTSIQEATDLDFIGNKIRNLAGDGFTPKLQRVMEPRILNITKNLALYPFALDDQFSGCCNISPFILPGSGFTIATESAKCLGISAPEYAVDAKYVPCTLEIEFRSTRVWGTRPFKTPTVNQGRRGWYTEGSTTKSGPIWNGNDPVSEDVLLDTDGKPIDTTLTIRGNPPVKSPQAVGGWTAPSPAAPGPAIILLWRGYDVDDFAQLFAGMGL